MQNSFQYINQICSKCASISPQDTRWYTNIKYPIPPNIQHKLERLTRHRVPSTCTEMLPESVIHTAMSISQSQLSSTAISISTHFYCGISVVAKQRPSAAVSAHVAIALAPTWAAWQMHCATAKGVPSDKNDGILVVLGSCNSPASQCSITMMEFACPNFSATQLKIPPLLQGHHVHLLPAKDLPQLVLFHNSKPFLKQPDRHTDHQHHPLLHHCFKTPSEWPPNSETNFSPNLVKCTLALVDLAYFFLILFADLGHEIDHDSSLRRSLPSFFFGIRRNRPNSHFAYFTHTSPNHGLTQKRSKKSIKQHASPTLLHYGQVSSFTIS